MEEKKEETREETRQQEKYREEKSLNQIIKRDTEERESSIDIYILLLIQGITTTKTVKEELDQNRERAK